MARVLEFEVQQHGWASAAIILNGKRLQLDASYVYDSFYGMGAALVSACNGLDEVEWLYFHEPSATHAVVQIQPSGQAQLSILTALDGFKLPRPKFGYPTTLVAEGTVLLRDMVTDVITAGSRMVDAYGADGYKERWEHDFPLKEIALLKQWRRHNGDGHSA